MARREIAVLVLGEEERVRSRMRESLLSGGCRVCTAATGEEALALLAAGAPFDALLLGGSDAARVLAAHRERGGKQPALSLGAALPGAHERLDPGAEGAELLAAVERVIELAEGRDNHVVAPVEENEFVTVSPSMLRVFEMVDRVARADVPVLIRGESGVGKEVVARTLHLRSGRRDAAFVKINCAALPSELLESELFGHEKGAFTGAYQEKPGKFEMAHKGTIFLDEIGEMAPALQAKLLQVLQDEEFYRVGGRRSIRVDARVVVATNRDLEREIERGGFREDLYYRLNVVSVRVPPLRERREDVAPLVAHFVERYARRYGSPEPEIRPEVLQRFMEHSWPGNVRELENLVRRLVVLGDEGPVLEELAVRGGRTELPAEPATPLGLKDISRRAAMLAERDAIDHTLKLTGWNKRRAALRLRISYKALLYKIKECGICDPRLAHVNKT